jgi:hypothetical protein
MPAPRLSAKMWAAAYIRRCQSMAVSAMVVHHGDDTAGVVLLKINTLVDGCAVYQPATDMDGHRYWRMATGNALVSETDADAYIDRQRGYDRDLWVIEVEDREGRHFLEEPVRKDD